MNYDVNGALGVAQCRDLLLPSESLLLDLAFCVSLMYHPPSSEFSLRCTVELPCNQSGPYQTIRWVCMCLNQIVDRDQDFSGHSWDVNPLLFMSSPPPTPAPSSHVEAPLGMESLRKEVNKVE